MNIVESDADAFTPLEDGVDYNANNPIRWLVRSAERSWPVAEREHYLPDSVQHLFPFSDLGLYGPRNNPNPRNQDEKNDFAKQNVSTFRLGDYSVTRGYVSAGGWTGCFLRLTYRGGPLTALGVKSKGNPGL